MSPLSSRPPSGLTGPPRPRPLLLLGLALLLLAGAFVIWRQPNQPDPPDGMASASVVREDVRGTTTTLTLRYAARGQTYTVTHDVDTAAYRAQGRVAWICFTVDDPRPKESRVRLPLDPLC